MDGRKHEIDQKIDDERRYFLQELHDWHDELCLTMRDQRRALSFDMIDFRELVEATLEYLSDPARYLEMRQWEAAHTERARARLAALPDHPPIRLDRYHFGFSFFSSHREFGMQ